MKTALVHAVSPTLQACELTYLEREAIDYESAVEQHKAYCRILKKLGCKIIEVTGNEKYPDATFVEDTAIVLDEIAVITNMGAESRRSEPQIIAAELAKYRELAYIKAPGTLEGGDVADLGKTILVGETARSNQEGIRQFREILGRFGYKVRSARVRDCLHFKSACAPIRENTLLVNPNWLHFEDLSGIDIIEIDASEPWAANAININGTVCLHAEFTRTAALLEKAGFKVAAIDISEFQKAEGGLSCLSLRFDT